MRQIPRAMFPSIYVNNNNQVLSNATNHENISFSCLNEATRSGTKRLNIFVPPPPTKKTCFNEASWWSLCLHLNFTCGVTPLLTYPMIPFSTLDPATPDCTLVGQKERCHWNQAPQCSMKYRNWEISELFRNFMHEIWELQCNELQKGVQDPWAFVVFIKTSDTLLDKTKLMSNLKKKISTKEKYTFETLISSKNALWANCHLLRNFWTLTWVNLH